MNPLLTDREFSLSLANPNPTSRRTKEGPVYRVSFELTREEWDWFMETETVGMVLECQAMVTHRNEPPREKEKTPREEKGKPGPLCLEAIGLCSRGDFFDFIQEKSGGFHMVGFVPSGDCGEYIKIYCGTTSRKELDTNPTAAARFAQLKREFLEWQR